MFWIVLCESLRLQKYMEHSISDNVSEKFVGSDRHTCFKVNLPGDSRANGSGAPARQGRFLLSRLAAPHPTYDVNVENMPPHISYSLHLTAAHRKSKLPRFG